MPKFFSALADLQGISWLLSLAISAAPPIVTESMRAMDFPSLPAWLSALIGLALAVAFIVHRVRSKQVATSRTAIRARDNARVEINRMSIANHDRAVDASENARVSGNDWDLK